MADNRSTYRKLLILILFREGSLTAEVLEVLGYDHHEHEL